MATAPFDAEGALAFHRLDQFKRVNDRSAPCRDVLLQTCPIA